MKAYGGMDVLIHICLTSALAEQIRRKWNWIGHTLRKQNAAEKEVKEWNPQGQRKRGRPKRSRQRTTRQEGLAVGKTWGEIKQLSKNHVRWRHFVGGWVGHKTGLDAVEKRKFSSPC
jgi:hypothetical protein